ncbi:MAG TPA: DNA gyrase subunit A [Candidatus Alectryocaccobium stercorigallinarum]|nr:DNA gyrase subunit A [Candidatus Alectryocaccobium stercorigallinarum]
MDDKIFDKIEEVDIKKKMESSYIDYAMSVIVSRALPDVRDGLKPVQRRILYSMIELNNTPDKPHRKCARIVGDTMGKYHPHGDSSIYGALVNMAQEWSTRYPLVDGHGNFGSVDGDGAAAMRYTEARLSKTAMEMISDINKDTVDFSPNFDDTEKEPDILPARFPNLLANGTTGIAVGMATNIPPHNMTELINAVVKIIDNTVNENRETSLEEVMEIIKGPDFPTGAEILGRRGIEEAYRTGHGKIKVRSITNIETLPNGKSQIIVTELPYLVNKARLIERMAELVKNKKLDGITAISDHSSREGMRICIELRKDVNANVMLNKLYKMTQLQDSFSVNMLALVDQQPKVLNLLQMLKYYLAHQEEVVTRRTKFDLNKAEERAHILEGLLKALDHIDRIIAIIRASANTQEAKANLIAEFAFSDAQAQAIVDMRLRALTGLERQKIENEYAELEKNIAEYRAILADRNKLLGVIREEILIVAGKYGDERRTRIGIDDGEFTDEDLIPNERTVIAKTNLGYIKRMTIDNFRLQNRGGKGIKGMQTVEEDFIEDLFMTATHFTLLFFTNRGRMYKLKAYEIPEASRTARGTAIVNLLQLQGGEKVTAIIPIEKFEEGKYLLMATKCGVVKKTPLMDFVNVRNIGITAIGLRDEDDLIEVKFTDGNRDVLMATANGQCIRFHESDVRSMGRAAAGVRGIRLADGDEVIGMQLDVQGKYVLCVSEKGMGKRTEIDKFTIHHRGGKGIGCYKITEKTGKLVGFKSVEDENEVLIITSQGIIIRTDCSSISIQSRNTSGVKIIDINDDVYVAGVAKVRNEEDDEPEAAENMAGEEITENADE